jgi:hypothetical protein
LGWIGQSSMLPSLAAINGHFVAIDRALPGAVLHVVCDARPELATLRIEHRPWSSNTEALDLAAADIGVSWLCDDLWSLGKCGLKVLQYMAAGLPVVANAVGIHRTLVIPGETGFLAESPDEWAQAVRRLANDPALRARMGAAARRRVEMDYNVRRMGPQFARLLRSLIDRSPVEKSSSFLHVPRPVKQAPARVRQAVGAVSHLSIYGPQTEKLLSGDTCSFEPLDGEWAGL